MTNRQWILKRRPSAAIDKDDLDLVDVPVPQPGEGQLLVRNILLSLDPTNRIWMSDREQYMPPVKVGDVMRGSTLGVVEQSRSDRFKPGDLVIPAAGGWQLYTVADAATAGRVRRIPGVPLSAHMSVLGATGMTAYFGLTDICRPQPGETLVVSAAAGAVGSIVGQIAKIKGARVIGIAGGAEKCRWLTDELGLDGAIDYRHADVGAELDRLCPDGVDMNFENVGGPIMDAVFSRLRQDGRMALCGMIADYNVDGPMPGPSDFGRIIMKRLTVRGFVVIDYLPRARDALTELGGWVGEGRIQWRDHIVDGIDNALDALALLFKGGNTGKLLLRLSPEP